MSYDKDFNLKKDHSSYVSGEFYYRAMDDTIEHCCPFVYDDSYFDHPTIEPNFDLIRFSLKLAMSASRKKDILRFYDAIGFSYTDKIDYQKEKKNILAGDEVYDSVYYPAQTIDGKHYINSIAYAIGTKKLKDKTVVLVTIRGGNYGIEWGGNFNIGDGIDVEGFNIASNQVIDGIKRVIKDIRGNIRLNICGYSRSAAVANLTAARIDNGEIKGLDRDNVSCFTYEAPRTTRNQDAFSERYNNIFNIINPGDLIPTFPFAQWGYRRYGRELNLPAYETDKNFDEKLKKMQKTMEIHLKTIYDISTNDAYLIDKFVSNLAFIMKDPFNYVKEYQNLIEKIFMNFDTGVPDFNKKEKNIIWQLKHKLFLIDPITYRKISPLLIKGDELLEFNFESPILQNHKMGTELAWIESFDGLNDFASGNYLLTYIDKVYDLEVSSQNELLVKYDKSSPIFINRGLYSELDFNKQTVIVLDDDRTYAVSFLDDINKENAISIYQFNQKLGVLTSGVTFITKGKNICGFIGEDINGCDFIVDSKLIGYKNHYYNNLPRYSIEAKIIGSGVYLGGGYFYPGMTCELIAIDKDDEFVGWYIDDKLISKNTNLVLKPTKDLKLTVKFSKK